MKEESVFSIAQDKKALIVTRDKDFRNPIRFPASRTGGILYLEHGNLRSSEEAALVRNFLKGHSKETHESRLVLISKTQVRIR